MTDVDSRRYSDHMDTRHSWEAGLGSTEESGLTILLWERREPQSAYLSLKSDLDCRLDVLVLDAIKVKLWTLAYLRSAYLEAQRCSEKVQFV